MKRSMQLTSRTGDVAVARLLLQAVKVPSEVRTLCEAAPKVNIKQLYKVVGKLERKKEGSESALNILVEVYKKHVDEEPKPMPLVVKVNAEATPIVATP